MTFIHLYLKKGEVAHAYLHWRAAMRMLENNFKDFKGRKQEFILVDFDSGQIISSQSCFRIAPQKNLFSKIREK